MKPVTQTKFGADGNCWLACIASILEIPLEAVPDVTHLYAENERGQGVSAIGIVTRWLMREHGLYLYRIHDGITPTVTPVGHHIMNGPSHRGYSHAVVGFEGRMVHDPHPDGTGIVTVRSYEVFGVADQGLAAHYETTVPAVPHPIAQRILARPTSGCEHGR